MMKLPMAALVAGALAVTSPAMGASKKKPQTPPPITTAVTVHQLGVFAFGNIPPEILRQRLAPGYTLKPCRGIPGYGASVVVSEQVLLDAPFVALPSHALAVLTCATPPPGYAHPDPVGEEDWYVLYVADDLDPSQQALLTQYGSQRERLTFTWAPANDLSFSFVARAANGSTVAAGLLASAGVPASAIGVPCVPTQVQGRTLQPNVASGMTSVLDFTKTESLCAGSGWLTWDGGSALGPLLNSGQFVPVTLSGRVTDAVNTYFAISDTAR